MRGLLGREKERGPEALRCRRYRKKFGKSRIWQELDILI